MYRSLATGPNGLVALHSQNEFRAHLKWGMLDHCYCVSCFMHSSLTSITGYYKQTVLRYLPYKFKHQFRMPKRTFQILSGNKSSLRAS